MQKCVCIMRIFNAFCKILGFSLNLRMRDLPRITPSGSQPPRSLHSLGDRSSFPQNSVFFCPLTDASSLGPRTEVPQPCRRARSSPFSLVHPQRKSKEIPGEQNPGSPSSAAGGRPSPLGPPCCLGGHGSSTAPALAGLRAAALASVFDPMFTFLRTRSPGWEMLGGRRDASRDKSTAGEQPRSHQSLLCAG